MTKKIISFILIQLVFILFLTPLPVSQAAPAISISAPSAVLLDQQGRHLVYAKTPHIRRAPASTTKVLTAIVAMDQLPLDKTVTIQSFVRYIEPSKVYLKKGEKYYVRDLIRATLIESGNDAAESLAVAAGGSKAGFARLMNQKVKRIGARHSHFVNASGLPASGQYSTSYDLALIMKEAQRYPFIVETLKTRTMTIRSLSGRRIYLKNHNKMLWRDRREVVGKTGWTRKAKHCFVGHIGSGARKVFVAMMGSHRLWKDLKTLIDYQFGAALGKTQVNNKIWSLAARKKIQLALKHAGYYKGKIDGKLGPQSLKAIQAFQRTNKLYADGIVGPATWTKLKTHL